MCTPLSRHLGLHHLECCYLPVSHTNAILCFLVTTGGSGTLKHGYLVNNIIRAHFDREMVKKKLLYRCILCISKFKINWCFHMAIAHKTWYRWNDISVVDNSPAVLYFLEIVQKRYKNCCCFIFFLVHRSLQ